MGERGLRQCRSENPLNAHSANALRGREGRGGLIAPRPPIVHFVGKQRAFSRICFNKGALYQGT